MISVLTALSAFAMAMGQIIGMTFEDIDVISYVLRIYVIVLCLLVILIEAEWTSLVKNSSILRYWITRGLFYAFVGVIGIQQNQLADSFGSLSPNFKGNDASIGQSHDGKIGGSGYSLDDVCCYFLQIVRTAVVAYSAICQIF